MDQYDIVTLTSMNIIINGGTRGIGKRVVLYLARDVNNRIMVTGRNEKSLMELAEGHHNIRSHYLDMADFETHEDSFIKAVQNYFKEVNILINMAGLLIKNDFMRSTIDEARQMMETNLFGPASVIRIIKPYMPPGSHIVNIASMGGFQGSSKYRGLSWYSASKAALACLSECLAGELNEAGISVNCLALGAVHTAMFEEAFPGFKAPVTATEMAEYISEFAIKGHKFMNGKVIPVGVNNP